MPNKPNRQTIELLEKMLAVLVMLAFILLILVQVGIYRGGLQSQKSWYGTEYDQEAVQVAAAWDEPYGVITLELVDLSRLEMAEIWRNGAAAANFGQAEVTLRVYDGDILALNVAAYLEPVRIRVKKISAGICGEFLLQDVEVCGEVAEIGRIVLKN